MNKPYVKEVYETFTTKLLIKDMIIATLLVAFLVTNRLFAFGSDFQLFLTILALWLSFNGLLYSIDDRKVRKFCRVLARNIDEHINAEILEFKDEKDEIA